MTLRATAASAAIAAVALITTGAAAPSDTVARNLLTEANIRVVGGLAGDGAGLSVSGAGDVNGDGVPDLLVGAPSATYSSRSGSGAAYVVFAQPNLTQVDLGSLGSHGYVVGGAQASAATGGSVANAGDVNGDGVPDAIVGARSEGNGAAYVVFGKSTTAAVDLSTLATQGFRMSGGFTSVGAAVAGAGDVNGDGKADVLIGAPEAVKPQGCCLNYGAAFVVFGKADAAPVDLGSLGAAGYRIDGASFGDFAGSAVASAGDINGDGKDDVLVSAPDAPYPPADRALAGKVYVVYGKADGTTIDLATLGTGGYEIDGPSQAAFVGGSVASAGDVNGDGTPDQLIGGGYSGNTYVVFGQPDSKATIDLASLDIHGYTISGANGGPPNAVASLGDVNGDDVPDAVIGNQGASYSGDGAGAAYVVYLHSGTSPISVSVLGPNGYRLDGGAAHDNAGFSVADAGDLNGDGVDDPIVGALNADPESRAQAGEADVAFFRPSNDDFADAEGLDGLIGIAFGTNVGATRQTGEPAHGGDPGSGSVWYRWVAPAGGRVMLTTDGSDFDTLLAAYTGAAVNALTEVASNNDHDGLATSEISFAAAGGTTYWIAVDGAGGDAGGVALFWQLSPPNDDFAAAQSISGDHGQIAGTTIGATKEPSEPNHAGDAGGSSTWYAWTASASGVLTLDTCTTTFDTLLALYTGNDVAHLTAVASNDDSPDCGLASKVAVAVVAGTTYRIAIDGFDGDWGNFVLTWTRTASPPPPQPPLPPANTASPTITGTALAGRTLTAAPGTWTGTAPVALTYAWERCDGHGKSCVLLPGKTATKYVIVRSDAGSTLRVVVTASNLGGRASATSAQTRVVTTPVRCVVPRLKGKTIAKARRALASAHCALGRVSATRSPARRGVIVSQRPRPGAVGRRGMKVSVVISKGRARR
jgi:FG-GAP repeat/PASTA domain